MVPYDRSLLISLAASLINTCAQFLLLSALHSPKLPSYLNNKGPLRISLDFIARCWLWTWHFPPHPWGSCRFYVPLCSPPPSSCHSLWLSACVSIQETEKQGLLSTHICAVCCGVTVDSVSWSVKCSVTLLTTWFREHHSPKSILMKGIS